MCEIYKTGNIVYIVRRAQATPGDSQTERGLRELRSRIVAGHWLANTKLREVPLAESLGLSRTPLRAALLQLEQEGLLQRQGGGYIVRSFSFEDALLAIELRGVMEGTAVRMAAERRLGSKQLVPIQETIHQIDELLRDDCVDQYGELNNRFHDQLCSLAGNTFIKQEVERANRLPFAAPSAFSSSEDDLSRFRTTLIVGQQHHHALVQAISRGEGSRAEALAREHAHLSKTNIEVAYRDRAEKHGEFPQLALVSAQVG